MSNLQQKGTIPNTSATATAHLSDRYKTNAHLLVTNSSKLTAAVVGEAWTANTPLKIDLKKMYVTKGDVIPTLDNNGELAVSSINVIVRSAAKRGPNDRALFLDCLVTDNDSSIPESHLVGCVPLNKDGITIKADGKLVRESIDLPLPRGSAIRIIILSDLEHGAIDYIQTDELEVGFRHDPAYKSIIDSLSYCLPNPYPNGLSESEITFSDDDEEEDGNE